MPPAPVAPAYPDSALPCGTRLGEFEVLGVLGVGGFGVVYLALDHALQREVAIKEYMPSALAGRTASLHVSLRSKADAETFALGLRSFVNEARLLARFDHPSLLKVYRFWEQHDTAYMAMPVYRGPTLREVRKQLAAPPDEAWLRALLLPLLGAIETLHAEGVYHRDIAPDNILIEPDGRPVLLDFGAARRVIGDRSQTLTAILKPAYAPIEQYAEVSLSRQGPWTDLYALGATLRFVITGEPPPPATARALHDEMPPLAQLGLAGLSPVLCRMVDWMLAPHPAQRPQSVAELQAVLDGRELPPALSQAPVLGMAAPAQPTPTAPAAAPGLGSVLDLSGLPPEAADDGPAYATTLAQAAAAAEPEAGLGPTVAPAAPQDAPPARPQDAAPAAGRPAPPSTPPARPRAAGLRMALAAAVLALAAGAAWWWQAGPAAESDPSVAGTAPASAASAASGAVASAASEPSSGSTDRLARVLAAPLLAPPPTAVSQEATAQDGAPAQAEAAVPRQPRPARPQPQPARTEPAATAKELAGADSAQGGAPRGAAVVDPWLAPVPARTQAAPGAGALPDPKAAAPIVARDLKASELARPEDPETLCGGRVLLALFWCMERECAPATRKNHPACRKWFASDRKGVSP